MQTNLSLDPLVFLRFIPGAPPYHTQISTSRFYYQAREWVIGPLLADRLNNVRNVAKESGSGQEVEKENSISIRYLQVNGRPWRLLRPFAGPR